MRKPFRAARLRPLAFILLSTVVAAVSACNFKIGGGIEARDTWTRSYPVKAGATLEVKETNGRIQVEATDGQTIEVTATRIAKATSEEQAKDALKDVTIDETVKDDAVTLDGTANDSAFRGNRSRSVEYVIKVPKATSVTIKSANADISVKGISGVLRVDSDNAKIDASGLADGADVKTTNGEITLDFANVGPSGVHCRMTNGQLIVKVPASTKATIAGRVVNGIVQAENLKVDVTEHSMTRLNGTIGGGGPEIRLEGTNGEVRLVGK